MRVPQLHVSVARRLRKWHHPGRCLHPRRHLRCRYAEWWWATRGRRHATAPGGCGTHVAGSPGREDRAHL